MPGAWLTSARSEARQPNSARRVRSKAGPRRRVLAAGWLPAYPDSMIARHGLDPDQVAPVISALEEGGDTGTALRRTTPEIAEALTVAGTPEECAERIRRDIVEPGIDHVLLAMVDPAVVESMTSERPEGLPDVREQLHLIHDRVFPSFGLPA